MNNSYYDFNSVRDQVVHAQKIGLCTFTIHPLDEHQRTTFKDDWSTDCKEMLCTKGWCTVCLDVTIKGQRTKMVTIYYFPGHTIAYVCLYGTIFEDLKKHKIINPNSLKLVNNISQFFPENVLGLKAGKTT